MKNHSQIQNGRNKSYATKRKKNPKLRLFGVEYAIGNDNQRKKISNECHTKPQTSSSSSTIVDDDANTKNKNTCKNDDRKTMLYLYNNQHHQN